MKHGAAFRKLSRTSSHRNLMLRNLVSDLLRYEQIKTTLPKAKETARLAEKMITLGKKGDLNARRDAEAFLLNSKLTLPKLFGAFAERYASRPGGYTRIHKFGRREGDNAPHAIIELVDGPRDIRFEMAARAVGRETVSRYLKKGQYVSEGDAGANSWLRDVTKWNMDKVLKYRGAEGRAEFEKKAAEWANRLIAEPRAYGGLLHPEVNEPSSDSQNSTSTVEWKGRHTRAGERLTGTSEAASSMGIARGALGKYKMRRSRFWEAGWKDAKSSTTSQVNAS
jgi:ribosomal protein L17